MNYKLITSSQIYFCYADDRHIIVIKEGDDIVGLNYMQGDEYQLFLEQYSDIDHDLTDFYNGVKYYLGGETELDRVNQAIWAYHDYSSRRDERETGFISLKTGL
jgi:hypothetical protein